MILSSNMATAKYVVQRRIVIQNLERPKIVWQKEISCAPAEPIIGKSILATSVVLFYDKKLASLMEW